MTDDQAIRLRAIELALTMTYRTCGGPIMTFSPKQTLIIAKNIAAFVESGTAAVNGGAR